MPFQRIENIAFLSILYSASSIHHPFATHIDITIFSVTASTLPFCFSLSLFKLLCHSFYLPQHPHYPKFAYKREKSRSSIIEWIVNQIFFSLNQICLFCHDLSYHFIDHHECMTRLWDSFSSQHTSGTFMVNLHTYFEAAVACDFNSSKRIFAHTIVRIFYRKQSNCIAHQNKANLSFHLISFQFHLIIKPNCIHTHMCICWCVCVCVFTCVPIYSTLFTFTERIFLNNNEKFTCPTHFEHHQQASWRLQ